MKEILLYNAIYDYSAEGFINTLEANKGNDIQVRMNCPGGNVLSAYGMIAKFTEHTAGKKVKVDGAAKSMGAYFCAAADEVECLNVSEFLLHRAAYPSWIESDKNYFTDEMKQSLANTNQHLRGVLEAKVPAAKFKQVTGVSYDDMFSLDNRLDVSFNAEQAQKMGLVTRIVPLTGKIKQEVEGLAAMNGIAAFCGPVAVVEPEAADNNNNKDKNRKTMTIAELNANHADLVKQIQDAAKAEVRDEICSLLAYIDVDKVLVVKSIKEGKALTGAMREELMIKAIGQRHVADANADSAGAVETGEKPKDTVVKTAQQIEDEKGFALVDQMLGIGAKA